MKSFIGVILGTVFPFFLFCQIGGVTGGKIVSFNAAVIPKGTAEFEPSYSFTSAGNFWDNQGNLQPFQSAGDIAVINTSIALRMAYAITDRLELASILTSGGSNWSFKHTSYTINKLDLGVMGGVNIPYGNTIIDKNNRQSGQSPTYGLGGIASYQFTDDGSLDVNFQYQDYFYNIDGQQYSDIFFSADYGQYFNNKDWQIIASFLYQYSTYDIGSGSLLTFNPGITFEMQKNYFIVINGSFALSGKNNSKANGFGIAWTITL